MQKVIFFMLVLIFAIKRVVTLFLRYLPSCEGYVTNLQTTILHLISYYTIFRQENDKMLF